jgi:hypothetical protein
LFEALKTACRTVATRALPALKVKPTPTSSPSTTASRQRPPRFSRTERGATVPRKAGGRWIAANGTAVRRAARTTPVRRARVLCRNPAHTSSSARWTKTRAVTADNRPPASKLRSILTLPPKSRPAAA